MVTKIQHIEEVQSKYKMREHDEKFMETLLVIKAFTEGKPELAEIFNSTRQAMGIMGQTKGAIIQKLQKAKGTASQSTQQTTTSTQNGEHIIERLQEFLTKLEDATEKAKEFVEFTEREAATTLEHVKDLEKTYVGKFLTARRNLLKAEEDKKKLVDEIETLRRNGKPGALTNANLLVNDLKKKVEQIEVFRKEMIILIKKCEEDANKMFQLERNTQRYEQKQQPVMENIDKGLELIEANENNIMSDLRESYGNNPEFNEIMEQLGRLFHSMKQDFTEEERNRIKQPFILVLETRKVVMEQLGKIREELKKIKEHLETQPELPEITTLKGPALLINTLTDPVEKRLATEELQKQDINKLISITKGDINQLKDIKRSIEQKLAQQAA